MISRTPIRCTIVLATVLSFSAPGALAERTKLKPGMNSFTPQQDIQLGQKYAAEAEKQSPLCNDPKVDAYLTKLGYLLIDQLNTFGNEYPWEFHCVNDQAVNAFALPGGFKAIATNFFMDFSLICTLFDLQNRGFRRPSNSPQEAKEPMLRGRDFLFAC
jgi:predicted Zn-dependent protease